MKGQEQVILVLLKVFCLTGFCSIALWITVYTRVAKWWTNPIGRSLVLKSSLLAMLLVPTALSLFFKFNRLTSDVAGWVDTVLIGAITPVMLWRSVIWWRTDHAGKDQGHE